MILLYYFSIPKAHKTRNTKPNGPSKTHPHARRIRVPKTRPFIFISSVVNDAPTASRTPALQKSRSKECRLSYTFGPVPRAMFARRFAMCDGVVHHRAVQSEDTESQDPSSPTCTTIASKLTRRSNFTLRILEHYDAADCDYRLVSHILPLLIKSSRDFVMRGKGPGSSGYPSLSTLPLLCEQFRTGYRLNSRREPSLLTGTNPAFADALRLRLELCRPNPRTFRKR